MSKIYQRNVQSSCHLAQVFLDTSAFILQKKSEIVEEIFFPALEKQFVRFYSRGGLKSSNFDCFSFPIYCKLLYCISI